MNYFFDTEFLEGKQSKTFLGLKYGETKPTIDLISIGIVSEDEDSFSKRQGLSDRTYGGREYYAISKDFNLKEAWNRYDLRINKAFPYGSEYNKVYWIRDNVLIPICKELSEREGVFAYGEDQYFTYKTCKRLINKYGKTNEQIAKEIKQFIYADSVENGGQLMLGSFIPRKINPIKFYAYYGDYDWVGFCWLFGKMIDLPKGFPMYCIDLKQMLDEQQESLKKYEDRAFIGCCDYKSMILDENNNKRFSYCAIKSHKNYPTQENEHNALADARWNKKLYEFLNKL